MCASGDEMWRTLPDDPDPVEDLGYDVVTWEVVRTGDGTGRYVFLPPEEEHIREDAFIVTDQEAVCDPLSRR